MKEKIVQSLAGALQPDRERALLLLCRRGSAEAFAEVVRAYQGRVLFLLWRLLGNRALAEDLTQEAFLRVFTRFHQYDSDRPFLPWLYRIAVNLVHNERRAAAHRELSLQPEVVEMLAVDDGGLGERRLLLEQALGALSVQDRLAVLLKHVEGMGYREISQVMGAPVFVLKMRLSRARRRLRAILTGLEGEREQALDFGSKRGESAKGTGRQR